MNFIENFIFKLQHTEKQKIETRNFLWFFYAVGVTGFMVPQTYTLFCYLIPFAHIISGLILMITHEGKVTNREKFYFGFVFTCSYVLEVIGVKTGVIFGHYEYSFGVGPKLFETPLMIGVIWLILVYITSSIVKELKLPKFIQAPAAAFLMVGMDFFIENIAPKLQMWSWENNQIPLQNYVAWFLIALMFHIGIVCFNINTKNRFSKTVFACLIAFFVCINIGFKIIG